MTLTKKLGAEFIGTFWLVLGGCGSAVLAAAFPDVGIGLLGVALAFGLTVLTMAYAIGHISGCHLNPAVSIGLWSGGRFSTAELGPYIIAQIAGGLAGARDAQGAGGARCSEAGDMPPLAARRTEAPQRPVRAQPAPSIPRRPFGRRH